MSRFPSAPRRLSCVHLAALLACGGLNAAHADEGDTPLIAKRAVPKVVVSQGKPPIWTGTAARLGVVSVANPYAAEAGAKILEQGGNAVDAAVAIAYALNVVEPQSAGVGGGGFMMIHLAGSGRTFAIDSREKAPAAATKDLFVGIPSFTVASLTGAAVGVPGMVRGTAHAVAQYGQLPLAAVLQPAIQLADNGFAATPRYAAVSCNNNNRSSNSPLAASIFCPNGPSPTGGPLVGTLVLNKPLAETFRLIATNGPDCFYKYMPEKGCDIAKGIIEGQKFTRPQAAGGRAGVMDYADLEAYQAAERVPTEGSYRGYRIKAMSPPSSGGLTLIQMLKMVERFPLGDASQGYGFGTTKTVNVMAEAMRIAFADRGTWMGDADFVPVPAKGLLNATYVGLRGAAIVPGTRQATNPVASDPRPYDVVGTPAAPWVAVADPVNGPGETTTHFSVVDKHGNMVSYTITIESAHGIGVFAGYTAADGSFKSHGFLLNNELTDFNLAPTVNGITGEAGYNDVQANKRPRSSMTPAMIFTPDGKPMVAYGSPGGATIINSVFNVTLNLIDHQMTIQAAIAAPRASITGTGSGLSLELGFPQATRDGLLALGYTLPATADIGSVQAVLVDPKTGKQYGAADARREGTVITLPRTAKR
jgi:gamma-glutamyltranspeptidase/glutathione hydrolase